MRAHAAQSKNSSIDKAGQVRWLRRLHAKGWVEAKMVLGL
jgi:hypothetical protein